MSAHYRILWVSLELATKMFKSTSEWSKRSLDKAGQLPSEEGLLCDRQFARAQFSVPGTYVPSLDVWTSGLCPRVLI